MDINQELRENIKKLLKDKKVDLVIGYGRGTLPLTSTPIFVDDEKDADKLIFDLTCQNNLATYLTKDKKKIPKNHNKIGIIAKGCDGRSIVLYIAEKQIKREDVFIIGVPCQGVIDKRKLKNKLGDKEFLKYKVDNKEVIVQGKDFTQTLQKQDILADSCLCCKYPNPPDYDIFIGKPAKEISKTDEFEIVDEFEKMLSDERWEYMKNEFSKCIRCYACRNVCPSCYCNECFVDQNNPQWFGKSPDFSDTMIFHLIRVLHIAGRCVDCGACVSACPLGINLRILNKKVEKEVRERFNDIAGLSIENKPAMSIFDENDKQEFIL